MVRVKVLIQRVLDLIDKQQQQVGSSSNKRPREDQEDATSTKALNGIRKAQLNSLLKQVGQYFKTKKINSSCGMADAGAAKGHLSMNPSEYEFIFGNSGTDTSKKESKVVFSRSYSQDDLKVLFQGIKEDLTFTGKAYRMRSFQKAFPVGTVQAEAFMMPVTYSKNTMQLKFEMNFLCHDEYE